MSNPKQNGRWSSFVIIATIWLMLTGFWSYAAVLAKWDIGLVLLAGGGVFIVGLVIMERISRPAPTPAVAANTLHGSAGFAPDDDIAALVAPAAAPLAPGAFMLAPLSETERLDLPRQLTTRHVMVLGPSGAGKTWTFFFPNCSRTNGASFVATDPKGELWQWTSGYQAQAHRYAPRDPDASAGLNWIPLCADSHLALLLARAVMESDGATKTDPFWTYAEGAFLAALFAHAATFNEPTPASAYDFLTSHNSGQLVEALAASPSATAKAFTNIFSQADAKLRGSIVIAVATRLTFLADPAVRRFTSSQLTPPDFGALRRQPAAVYWVLQENDVAVLRPLSALFYTLLLHQLKQEEPSVPVTLYLDELANIGKIPDFASEVTVARGRDIAFVLGLQSIAQLDALYGHPNARTVIDNCQTKIALAGLANDSAELISRELGEATVSSIKKTTSYNTATAGPEEVSRSFTQEDHRRRLLTADEVRRIRADEMLVICTNLRPLLLSRINYTGEARAAAAPTLGEARAAKFKPPPPAGVPALPPPLPGLDDYAS